MNVMEQLHAVLDIIIRFTQAQDTLFADAVAEVTRQKTRQRRAEERSAAGQWGVEEDEEEAAAEAAEAAGRIDGVAKPTLQQLRLLADNYGSAFQVSHSAKTITNHPTTTPPSSQNPPPLCATRYLPTAANHSPHTRPIYPNPPTHPHRSTWSSSCMRLPAGPLCCASLHSACRAGEQAKSTCRTAPRKKGN